MMIYSGCHTQDSPHEVRQCIQNQMHFSESTDCIGSDESDDDVKKVAAQDD